MTKNSYTQRLFRFYVLTLVILTSLCYVILFAHHYQHRKQASVDLFEDIYNELSSDFKNHLFFDVEGFLVTHIDRNDISYRLMLMAPSGRPYIHDYRRDDQKEHSFFTFPYWQVDHTLSAQYKITRTQLLGWSALPNGYHLYIQVVHKPLDIQWFSLLFWLPILVCLALLFVGIYLAITFERSWDYLIDYSHDLPQKLDEPYAPLDNKRILDGQEIKRLANNLNRINQQLHHHYRLNQILDKRLQRMVEFAPLPVFLVTRTGHISYFNKPFEQSFMTSYREEVSYHLTDFIIGSNVENRVILREIGKLRIPKILNVVSIEDNTTYLLHLQPWMGRQGQVQGFNALLVNANLLEDHILAEA